MAQLNTARWPLVSSLLDQLLDADAAGRDLRLDQIRRDDHRLAVELESLLAQETAANLSAFLEGSVLQGQTGAEGEVVGSYTLQTCLGRGGMGCVWLARRSDGRYEGQAAVKFPNLALLGRGGIERFQREGSILARLTHPNIARLLDAGVANNGRPYLVLEYVDGAPIDRWCEARALDAKARVRLFIDVLGCVAHAHSKLILHRDLKPSNILVTDDAQVKLLDFGIAKLLDEVTPAGEPTAPACQAFTLDFAAPEQVRMLDATTATDVYALGVLLYVMLSGQHPTALKGASEAERLQAILAVEPVPVSEAARRGAAEITATTRPQHTCTWRKDLDTIVAKALKKIPAQRYATPNEMAEDLRRYLNHEPVGACTPSPWRDVASFVRCNLHRRRELGGRSTSRRAARWTTVA